MSSGSDFAAFIVKSLSCDTFFVRIGYDAVIPRGYQLGGSSGGAAFKVTHFSGETLYARFEDDAGMV